MKLIRILKDVARQIREIEDEAIIALYENSDKETYILKLNLKTEMLAQLPQMCAEASGDLTAEMQSFVRDRLGGISFSAGKALQLNSIFYMSALLYPEDYQEGDQNDLENFIEKLECLVC